MTLRLKTQREVFLLGLVVLTGCAAQGQRAAPSPLGCMQSVVRALPADLSDAQKHCVASGLIQRHCSLFEAVIAGAGKEMKDAVAGGDASWQDWRSDRKGMRCADGAAEDADVTRCCAQ